MCKDCICNPQLNRGELHVGYSDEEHESEYHQLMEGDVLVDDGDSLRRLDQENWWKLWDVLEQRGWHTLPSLDGCHVCNREIEMAPAIEGECYYCGADKHEKYWEIYENQEQIREEMEWWEENRGFGPGKATDPMELAVRVCLHCPDDHWVCSDCLMERGWD